MDFIAYVLAPIVLVAALLLGGADAYGRYQCSNYERISGKETKWATLDACYIKTAQGFERWDEYKARSTASEGLSP